MIKHFIYTVTKSLGLVILISAAISWGMSLAFAINVALTFTVCCLIQLLSTPFARLIRDVKFKKMEVEAVTRMNIDRAKNRSTIEIQCPYCKVPNAIPLDISLERNDYDCPACGNSVYVDINIIPARTSKPVKGGIQTMDNEETKLAFEKKIEEDAALLEKLELEAKKERERQKTIENVEKLSDEVNGVQ